MTAKKKALLVVPPATKEFWDWAPPPLSLLYLAANSPDDTEVWDGTQKGCPASYIEQERPSVVGVSIHTSTRTDALRILRRAKDAGCVTVVGGPHFNGACMLKQWKEKYPFVDHIVRGAGELVWKGLVEGSLAEVPPRFLRVALDATPAPLPWHLLDPRRYSPRDFGFYRGVDLSKTPRISLISSRGCVGHCDFCSAWMHGYDTHSYEWLEINLKVLAQHYGIRHICWDDDLFTESPAFEKLCELQGSLGMVWQATTRVDKVTEHMVQTMADGGCWQLAVGVESFSEEVRKNMNKEVNIDRLKDIRKWTSKYGIKLSLLMMAGYPGQTPIDESVDVLEADKIGPDSVGCLGYTVVLPGTALYFKARQKGYVEDSIWERDDFEFLPANREWRIK